MRAYFVANVVRRLFPRTRAKLSRGNVVVEKTGAVRLATWQRQRQAAKAERPAVHFSSALCAFVSALLLRSPNLPTADSAANEQHCSAQYCSVGSELQDAAAAGCLQSATRPLDLHYTVESHSDKTINN